MYDAEIRARAYLEKLGLSDRIIDFKNTDITIESTYKALGEEIEADRICKGLAFKGRGGRGIVVLASGLSRVDNRKFQNVMGFRPSMIPADRVEEIVGHKAGTINPFCINETADLYLDTSILKPKGKTVFPGIGGEDSVVELTIDELERVTNPRCWIDVTK